MWKCVCGNGIYSISHWEVIQLERAFLGEPLESILRPCSRNKNSINENKISYLQVAKAVSIGLNIDRGEAPNSKQTKIKIRNNFWNFYSAVSIFTIFSISGVISQIDESTDR